MSDYLPQSMKLPLRREGIRAVAIHTTGSGLARVAAKAADVRTDPLAYDDAAERWYRRSGFRYYGHYLVGQSGYVAELAPLEVVTWHTTARPGLYGRERWARYHIPRGQKLPVAHGQDPRQFWGYWFDRFGAGAKPLDLLDGHRRPNNCTIGIDFLPAPDGSFSAVQMAAGARLIVELCDLFDVPHDRRHVLGHEDIHPFARRGWCPGRKFPWQALDLQEAA